MGCNIPAPITIFAALCLFLLSRFSYASPTIIKEVHTTLTVVTSKNFQVLSKRAHITNCDGRNIFFCPTGTCYSGGDGYIGCCSVSSCAVRTACVDYKDLTANGANCDQNTGGCLPCTNPAAPSCLTLSNALEDFYIVYCDPSGGYVVTSYRFATTHSLSVAQLPMATTAQTSTKNVVSTATQSSQPRSSTTGNSASGTTPIAESTASSGSDLGISNGALAGIVIGGVAVILLVVAIWCFRGKFRKAVGGDPSRAGYDPPGDMGYMYGYPAPQPSQPISPPIEGTPLYGGKKAELSGRTSPKEVDHTPSSVQTKFGQSPPISDVSDPSPRQPAFFQENNTQQPQRRRSEVAPMIATTASKSNQNPKPAYTPYRPTGNTSTAAVGQSTATGWNGYKHLSAEEALEFGWKDSPVEQNLNK